MHLISVMDDTLDVYEGDEHIAQIALMTHGWAVYGVGATGRIREQRDDTFATVMLALMYIKAVRAGR